MITKLRIYRRLKETDVERVRAPLTWVTGNDLDNFFQWKSGSGFPSWEAMVSSGAILQVIDPTARKCYELKINGWTSLEYKNASRCLLFKAEGFTRYTLADLRVRDVFFESNNRARIVFVRHNAEESRRMFKEDLDLKEILPEKVIQRAQQPYLFGRRERTFDVFPAEVFDPAECDDDSRLDSITRSLSNDGFVIVAGDQTRVYQPGTSIVRIMNGKLTATLGYFSDSISLRDVVYGGYMGKHIVYGGQI